MRMEIHSRLRSLAIGEGSVSEVLDLLDWKRRVFALYAEGRGGADPRAPWERWRAGRAGPFRSPPPSPRPGHHAPDYFDYHPARRLLAHVVAGGPGRRKIGGP